MHWSTAPRRSTSSTPPPPAPARRLRPGNVLFSVESFGRASTVLGVDLTPASLVLHVIEELCRHLGHGELAADALLR